MSKPGILKLFLFATVFVAVVSLLVMIYYSASFTQFKRKLASTLDWSESTEIYPRELPTNGTFPGNSTTNSNIAVDNIPVLDVHNEVVRGDVENLLKNAPKVDPTGSVSQQNKMTQNTVDLSEVKNDATLTNVRSEELCPEVGPSLVGPLAVDQTVPKMEDLEKDFSSEFGGWVNKGGTWAPTECKARLKMVLVVPYRNRYEQLAIFLHHIHPILKRQNIDYRIVIVEQLGDTPFNRGMLFNIGFKEATKLDQFTCFIFHDVDLIPEDDRNEYSCPSSPRHLSVAVDKFGYRLPYTTIFGGAGSFSREHYELINGFSNQFWGWGGEDDDLYNRINAKGLQLTRPSIKIGRYKMIKLFHSSGVSDPERFDKLRDSGERMGHDGLNSLKYVIKQVTEHLLYTLISIDINRSMLDSR